MNIRLLFQRIAAPLMALLALKGCAHISAPETHWPAIHRDWQLQVMAHRGGMLEGPDSTEAAFDHAVAVGADWLELDVRLSADGHLVVFHDGSLERTTDSGGLVSEATLDELRVPDAAYWWPHDALDDGGERVLPKQPEYSWRGHGLRILTLEEVFTRYPDHRIVIDIKSPGPKSVQAMRELLERHDRWTKTVISSFHDESLNMIRQLAPRTLTATGPREVRRFVILHKLGLARFWRGQGRFLIVPMQHGSVTIVSPGFVRAAHAHGLPVYVWTINDAATMHQLINWGVDGIITDRPKFLRQLLRERRHGLEKKS